ncbi:MAG: single-stranded DNA-binding protein [Raineya sp.]|jgi:single-stranded DNA-binding protein|nr:single-stranded DNA-binding protein [Raineya sp.]
MNIAILSGRVTKDPIQFTDAKTHEAKVKVTLVTNEYMMIDGVKKQIEDFHSLQFPTDLQESVMKYVKKNSSITIQGKIKNKIRDGNTFNYILVEKWEFQNR